MCVIEDAERALSKAKINLLIGKQKSAFLATLVFGLKTEISNEFPTAATDGTTLHLNPVFFLNLSADEQITLVAHEAYHVALSHVLRLGSRDMKLWNIATDFAINLILNDAGFKPIAGWLLDKKYQGKTADQIYDDLLKNTKEIPAPNHLIQPKDGAGKPVDDQITKAKIDKLIAKAATQSKMAGEKFGDMAGDLQRAISEAVNPKLDWQTLLMNYMSQFQKNDYSYRRPNKKYLPDFYMPTLYSEALGKIGIAFDASASVSDEDFAIFKSEVDKIQMMLQPESIDLISFDTQVQSHHVLSQGESINNIEFMGYGGTSLRPVFEHFAKVQPEVLIVFSDLDCRPWTEEPEYPVLWIAVGHYRKPEIQFGTLIEYEK